MASFKDLIIKFEEETELDRLRDDIDETIKSLDIDKFSGQRLWNQIMSVMDNWVIEEVQNNFADQADNLRDQMKESYDNNKKSRK